MTNSQDYTTMASPPSAPPSLASKPICALVEPGKCQLTEEWQPLQLIERISVSPTSSVLRFQLPDTAEPLNLSTCACILAKADTARDDPDKITKDVIRPYTPISTNALKGCFDLLVKDYGPESKMSHELCARMNVGDSIHFKHMTTANVKIQAPFVAKDIIMLVGGTGITPMIQALHAILGDESKRGTQKVTMLYGSRASNDILGKDMMDQWADAYSDQFTVTHILSEEPTDSDWTGQRGYIDKERLQQVLPPPSVGTDVMIFVCGPPPLYNVMCGPREDKDMITGLLGDLGYQANQVYKF